MVALDLDRVTVHDPGMDILAAIGLVLVLVALLGFLHVVSITSGLAVALLIIGIVCLAIGGRGRLLR